MKKTWKRILCFMLSLLLVVSSVVVPDTMRSIVKAEALDNTTQTKAVNDLVEVDVDGVKATALQLYMNGVYETTMQLQAGDHVLKLKYNGEVTDKSVTFTLEQAKEVIVRYRDGELLTSVTNADKFHTASLVGNFYGLEFLDDAGSRYNISSWNPSDANAEISYVGGGMYRRTLHFTPLAADLTLSDGGYKVAFDKSWNYSISDGDGNIELTIPAGTSSFTVLVDEVNQVVYDSVRSAQVTVTQNSGDLTYSPIDLSVSLIGTIRMAGDDNWNIKATNYNFTQISDTLFVYQMVAPKGDYQYKVTFNNEKWYEKGGNNTVSVTEDNTNIIFVYDAKTQELYDSVSEYNAVATKLGFAEEPAQAQIITGANGTTTFVTTAATSETDSVAIVYAPVHNINDVTTVKLKPGKDKTGKFNGTFSSDAVFFGDDAVNIAFYYVINGSRYLDSNATTVEVDGVTYSNYTRDTFTGRLVNVPGTFPGKSWDATSNAMTYLGNGLYSYTFKEVPAANYQFKIAMGAWTENYGVDGVKDGDNYQVSVTAKRDVTVYYTDLSTHRAVTDLDYVFATVKLAGTGIKEGTLLTDPGLTSIYSVTLPMKTGTYNDLSLEYNGKTFAMDAFSLSEDKDVTFYFDPVLELYYNNSNLVDVDASKVVFDSKDTTYKSTFGAMEEDEKVTFAIKTDASVTKANLVIKGKANQTITLTKSGEGDATTWSGDVSIPTYGSYQYFFVLYYGSSIVIYSDDDGYYGTGMVTDLNNVKPYDLTVYKKGYTTPDWMKNSIIYQIFPDRFFNGDTSNDKAQTLSRGSRLYELMKDWYIMPENPEQEQLHPETYPANAYKGDGTWSNEIYGGDLQGIIKRMDYLKSLGVNVIYLNPVFSSISSHRYDTSDYTKIDPILGDLGDFTELVAACEKNGMHIVLDGVFNHVSDDSIYFDRYYKFVGKNNTVGAYPFWAYVYDDMAANGTTLEQAKEKATTYFKGKGVTDFTYTEWFTIYQTTLKDDDGKEVVDTIGERTSKPVYGYDGWWGYDSMPVVKSTNGSEYQTSSWADEIIDGENSVCSYWLEEGANGWRLDVANEVSDETWQKMRESVKSLSSDYVIIGEIWDEATSYLLGDMYDSVMNYVFRNAVLSYATGGSSVDSMNTLERIRELYPQEAYYAMMNLVGSHDTTRVLSYLDGVSDDRSQKEVEKAFPTYATTSELAKKRQYLVAFLQMTYPGAPTIYYGDEIGMVGSDDPDNRRAMEWGKGNQKLVEWYASLAAIRNSYSSLRTGEIVPLTVAEGDTNKALMAYVRKDAQSTCLVVGNNSDTAITVSVPVGSYFTTSTLTNLVDGTKVQVSNNVINITIPALSGVIYTNTAKDVAVNLKGLAPAYDAQYIVKETTDKPDTPVVVAPSTVTDLKASKVSSDSITLTWKSLSSGVKYEVYRLEQGTWKKLGDVSTNSYTNSKLVWSTKYSYKVRAYKLDGTKRVYGNYSSVVSVTTKAITAPAKVTNLKVKAEASNKAQVTWNKVTGATGYQVYMKTGSGDFKLLATVKGESKVTYSKTGLKAGITYQFAVRAYKTVAGKTSYGAKATSSVVRMPVTKPTTVKSKRISYGKVKITWNKVSDASGYAIYMKTNKGSYIKVGQVGKNTTDFIKWSLKKGNTYQFKVKAFKKVNGKTYYSDFSSSTSSILIK